MNRAERRIRVRAHPKDPLAVALRALAPMRTVCCASAPTFGNEEYRAALAAGVGAASDSDSREAFAAVLAARIRCSQCGGPVALKP